MATTGLAPPVSKAEEAALLRVGHVVQEQVVGHAQRGVRAYEQHGEAEGVEERGAHVGQEEDDHQARAAQRQKLLAVTAAGGEGEERGEWRSEQRVNKDPLRRVYATEQPPPTPARRPPGACTPTPHLSSRPPSTRGVVRTM